MLLKIRNNNASCPPSLSREPKARSPASWTRDWLWRRRAATSPGSRLPRPAHAEVAAHASYSARSSIPNARSVRTSPRRPGASPDGWRVPTKSGCGSGSCTQLSIGSVLCLLISSQILRFSSIACPFAVWITMTFMFYWTLAVSSFITGRL